MIDAAIANIPARASLSSASRSARRRVGISHYTAIAARDYRIALCLYWPTSWRVIARSSARILKVAHASSSLLYRCHVRRISAIITFEYEQAFSLSVITTGIRLPSYFTQHQQQASRCAGVGQRLISINYRTLLANAHIICQLELRARYDA